MADSTISNLTTGVQPVDADYFVTVQGGATVKVTAKQLGNYAAVAQFSGSSTRYPGDFSNAALALRTLFLSSTVNGITDVGAIPNGAATTSRWTAYNASTPTNANFLSLEATSTLLTLKAGVAGAGTMLPFTVNVNGTEMYRVGPVSLNMLFGSTTDDGIHKYQFTGSYSIVGNYQLTGNSVILGNESVSGDLSAVTFNGGPLSGDRDRIINGRYRVDQENVGASRTLTAGAALSYVIDRWYAYAIGGNITSQQVLVGSNYAYRFTGGAGNTGFGWAQRIESLNILDQAGNSVILRAKFTASTAKTITWTASYANTTNTFGSLAAPTKTLIATGSFNVTTAEADFYTPITLPAGAASGVEILFTGTALTAGQTVTVRDVGLLTGTVNEPNLPNRLVETDRMLCSWHYQKSFNYSTAAAQNVGLLTGEYTWAAFQSGATNNRPSSITFPNGKMGGAPTITLYNPAAANALARDEGVAVDCTATTITAQSENGFILAVTANAASVVGSRLGIHWAARWEL